MRKILLLLILLGFFGTQISAAQQIRFLPEKGKRGFTGNNLPLPKVAIGRETFDLAPGGLIFDTHNRTILHNSLPVGADVWYLINSDGQLQRMYILRPEEQARLNQAK